MADWSHTCASSHSQDPDKMKIKGQNILYVCMYPQGYRKWEIRYHQTRHFNIFGKTDSKLRCSNRFRRCSHIWKSLREENPLYPKTLSEILRLLVRYCRNKGWGMRLKRGLVESLNVWRISLPHYPSGNYAHLYIQPPAQAGKGRFNFLIIQGRSIKLGDLRTSGGH